MKCNEFREKVADLFDKTIDMQTQAELDEHMKSCPAGGLRHAPAHIN